MIYSGKSSKLFLLNKSFFTTLSKYWLRQENAKWIRPRLVSKRWGERDSVDNSNRCSWFWLNKSILSWVIFKFQTKGNLIMNNNIKNLEKLEVIWNLKSCVVMVPVSFIANRNHRSLFPCIWIGTFQYV